MARSNVFEMRDAPVNAFLFADVGTETNGSTLTVLSVLARLGEDPWAVAAEWTRLPRAAIVDRLESSIARMPMSPQALRDAHATATRLSLLLPSRRTDAQTRATGTLAAAGSAKTHWAPMIIFYCAMAFGMAMNVMIFAAHEAAPAPSALSTARPPRPVSVPVTP